MEVKKYFSKDQIVGKQVIDSGAKAVGTVKELSFDLVGREIALTIATEDEREFTVVSSDVSNVGDVILLNKVVDLSTTPPTVKRVAAAPPPPPSKPGLCKVCGFQNDEKARFCIKCGAKLS